MQQGQQQSVLRIEREKLLLVSQAFQCCEKFRRALNKSVERCTLKELLDIKQDMQKRIVEQAEQQIPGITKTNADEYLKSALKLKMTIRRIGK